MATGSYGCCYFGKNVILCHVRGPDTDPSQWQSLITHRGPYDACKGVQLLITALLGQIYGALSKVGYSSRWVRFTPH
jgi:hypothetical protein